MKPSERLAEYGEAYTTCLDKNNYDKAKQILLEAIDFIKGCYREVDEDNRNQLYYWAILFRGLLDYVSIIEIAIQDHWADDKKLVEKVWDWTWGCKDRLDFCSSYIGGKSMQTAKDFIANILEFYNNNFGIGIYNSPDILIKKSECSICGVKIRKCEHMLGRLYNGIRCQEIVKDFEVNSISLVKNPHDPRCRIWPWNFKNKNTYEAAVICFFRIDDFFFDDNWKKDFAN